MVHLYKRQFDWLILVAPVWLVKDKNWSVLMVADKQLSRRAEHFEQLPNRTILANTTDIHAAGGDLPIDCDKPTKEEIGKVIKQLWSSPIWFRTIMRVCLAEWFMRGNWQRASRLRLGWGRDACCHPFCLSIDRIMSAATNQKRNWIQWTLWSQLDDLDFADDLVLSWHNHQQMQEKTTDLHYTSVQARLTLNKQKT